jgi:hypothetical protein
VINYYNECGHYVLNIVEKNDALSVTPTLVLGSYDKEGVSLVKA